MSTEKTGASNAKTNEPDKKAATPETAKKSVTGDAGESAKAKADEPKATGKDAAENEQASASTGEYFDDGAELDREHVARQTFQFRGLLMAILVKLPPALAYSSQGKALDDMTSFVESYETFEERYVAVELIKAVAESNINDIPSGGYQSKVRSAMDVIKGTSQQVSDIRDPHSQGAALQRLNYSIGGMELPPEHERMKQDNEQKAAQTGTDEQAAAYARLYGS